MPTTVQDSRAVVDGDGGVRAVRSGKGPRRLLDTPDPPSNGADPPPLTSAQPPALDTDATGFAHFHITRCCGRFVQPRIGGMPARRHAVLKAYT